MAFAEAVFESVQVRAVSVLLIEMPKVPVAMERDIGDWSVTL